MAIEPFLGTRVQSLFLPHVFDNTLSAYKTHPCYFALFVLRGVFTPHITLNALWNRNIIQLCGLIIFSGELPTYYLVIDTRPNIENPIQTFALA
ncbi:hypothetical protein CALVIDRAFT_594715 [Calocera viscosa TUFC12733]|uniref:Uncharacterized protein n=1 Tax=Calocera viscosa (strain TUFC12733) TaxID=1330018 RepID=A0A167RS03_CALVF|nr:hypothetical protein CALVIDRAFT_594715 [Calocera viscosa TUFC12733]